MMLLCVSPSHVLQLKASTMDYGLPIGVLSYGWCGKAHPDAKGWHLRLLVPLLKAIVAECDKVGDHFSWGLLVSRHRFAESPCHARACKPVVTHCCDPPRAQWDFMSLPQRGYTNGYNEDEDDRTGEESDRFKKGLKSINEWYSARFTHTFVLDGPMPSDSENTREPFVVHGFGEEESGRGWVRRLPSG